MKKYINLVLVLSSLLTFSLHAKELIKDRSFLRGFNSDSEKKAMKKAEKEDEEIEKKLKKIEEAHKK